MKLEKYYNYLIESGLVSDESLNLVTRINGCNENTLNDVLYVITGYRDLEQYTEYEDEETYQQYFKEEEE